MNRLTAARSWADPMIVSAGDVVENSLVRAGNRGKLASGEGAASGARGSPGFYHLSSFKHSNEIVVALKWRPGRLPRASSAERSGSGSPGAVLATLEAVLRETPVNLPAGF